MSRPRCCSTSRSRRSTRPCAQRLRDELRDLQAQLRLPMLLITHDDDDVRQLADQVVYLHAGKVVEGAATQEMAFVG